MKKFKDILTLLEFDTGSGKMEYGEKNREQMAGEFVARLIELHDNMPDVGGDVHPALNMKFLMSARNYFLGKSFGPNDPEHGTHGLEENLGKYKRAIKQEYPHLMPFVESELRSYNQKDYPQ